MKVSLGIMPDHTGSIEGVKADIVSKDKPADRAGIKAGDVIIAINGKDTKDLYQYMEALSTVDKGDTIVVKILREEQEIEIKVKL
jgi:S1-C subfamily serine protease